jgi:dipeptidyl aminopeptidase/acylaminoacyl peptidase
MPYTLNKPTLTGMAIAGTLAIALGTGVAASPSIEQFMKIRAPNSPTLSPDGSLFVRDWPDGVNQLYHRADATKLGGELRRLTDFEDGLNSYALSPDGKHIILSAASGGSEQDDLYHLDVQSGEITPLLLDQDVVYGFQFWYPDSSGFAFTANDDSRSDFHLYSYHLKDGDRVKLLDRPGYWYATDVTRDGNRLLVGQYFSASHADVYELDTRTNELTKLNIGEKIAYNAPAGYLPGDSMATVISDADEDGIRRLFVRSLRDQTVHKPLPSLEHYEIEGWTTNVDRTLAAITYNRDGYRTKIVVSLPQFDVVDLPEIDEGVVSDVDLRGNTLVWTLSNAREPGLAYALEVGKDTSATQLTEADTQGIDLSAFPLPQLITYESFDGLKIPAFLYTPPGYEPGQPIPFIAHYHGGPESQFRPWFSALTQYLLASGYGIIQPNVRGSTGYGRAFHMMDNYTKRWDSVRDGTAAARWLVENGYAEAGRIAAYGGSYGGFMSVATIIEDPEVYGASINVVGIVNFVTFLEQTRDYRRALREAEYGPLSDREFLESISPIHRIDEITVPMLIAHGLNDPRVPVGEAMQLAIGLQRRGYDPELLYFPDEGHGFAKLENRLLFAERMTRFLDEHIGH